jgi:hypothetical protein
VTSWSRFETMRRVRRAMGPSQRKGRAVLP